MERAIQGIVHLTVSLLLVVLATGCASVTEELSTIRTPSPRFENPADVLVSAATSDPFILVADPRSMEDKPIGDRNPASGDVLPTTDTDSSRASKDEPYDPFAQEVAEVEEYDPWEKFNVAMFNFNRKFDQYVLKPVATAYDKIVPNALQLGLNNFFHNVRFVPRLMNNLFQAKVRGAGLEVGRFLINSTIGLAGFFDPARNLFHLETPDEDFGQTLGRYGVQSGPYLVLPFLPPLTLRDASGFLFVDLALDPINYMVFPVMPYRFAGQPMATVRDTATIGWWSQRVTDVVNQRSINLEVFAGVEESTIDLYGAVRNAYLQRRAKMVRE